MDDIKYDAILRDWEIVRDDERCRLNGKIYNDSKERFYQGAIISTSRLVSIDFKTMIAYTKNSIYKLGE